MFGALAPSLVLLWREVAGQRSRLLMLSARARKAQASRRASRALQAGDSLHTGALCTLCQLSCSCVAPRAKAGEGLSR